MKYPRGVDGSLDRIFSKLVRERADYICEHCGINLRHDPRRMHCAHIHSRKHRSTRWRGNGACCLCASCHRRFTDFPIEWQGAARKILGDGEYEDCARLANEIRKYTKVEKAEMLEHYKAQLKYMDKRRVDGEIGYLDFVSYD